MSANVAVIPHGYRTGYLPDFVAVLQGILELEQPEGTISGGAFKKGYLFVSLSGVECQLSGDSTVAGVEAFLRAVRLFDVEIKVVANKVGVINKVVVGAEGVPISGFYLYTSQPQERECVLVEPELATRREAVVSAGWQAPDLKAAPTASLFTLFGAVVAELRMRDAIKTKNVIGEYAEWLVAAALGGELAPASMKSYDLTCAAYGAVQVKARGVSTPMTPNDRESGAFSSPDFDHAVFVMLSEVDLSVIAAVLYSREVLRSLWTPKYKGTGPDKELVGHVLKMTPAKLAAGTDITAWLRRAAAGLD